METMPAMNVAEHVISICGGAAIVASWLGLEPPAVYRWTYPRGRGGTGGLIPSVHQSPLLRAAKLAGKPLQPSDFFDPDVVSLAINDNESVGECAAATGGRL